MGGRQYGDVSGNGTMVPDRSLSGIVIRCRISESSKCGAKRYLIARGIGVIPRAACDSAISQTVEVKKMLHGLINSFGSDGQQT